MIKFILFILITFFYNGLFAQNRILDSLKVVLINSKDTSRVNVLNELTKASHYVDDDAVFRYASEAKSLSEILKYKKGLARALCNLGVYYAGKDESGKAKAFLKQSLSVVDPNDYYLTVILNHNLSFFEEDPKRKLDYLKEAVEAAKQGKHKRLGFFYHSLGTIYYRSSEYDTAFSYYIAGLKAAEQLKDSTSILLNLDAIGDVLSATADRGDDNSFSFCMQALIIAEQTRSNKLIAVVKNNLAGYYRKKGNLDTALFILTQSLALSKEIKDRYSISENYADIGLIYHQQHKYDSALASYKKALFYIDQSRLLTAGILTHMGATYNAMGNYPLAILHLKRAVAGAKNLSNEKYLVDAYYELFQAYRKLSNFKKALEYHELYHITHDSVYNVETGRRLVSMQAKYEIEKKEHAIDILERNNSIKDLSISKSNIKLALMTGLCVVILIVTFLLYNRYRVKQQANVAMVKANKEILSMVKEKEVLVQEIHHRAKNNLQMISSLLIWQTETIEDKEMIRILNEGQSRIKSMALLHETLYRSENVAQLDLDDYIANLIDFLENIYNKDKTIKVDKFIQPIPLDIDVTIPLGLIITELISNAFKYAFAQTVSDGCIEVLLREEKPEVYQLQIKDNGIGISEEVLGDLKGNTMGIPLVKILVKQISGHLDIQNRRGTIFSITFSNIHYQKKSTKSHKEYADFSS